MVFDILKEKISSDTEFTYGLLANFFNAFCANNGIQSIAEIINIEKSLERATSAGFPNYKFPLDMIAMLLYPLKGIKGVAKEEICKEIATIGKDAFFKRIQNLDDKEIKDLNKDAVSSAMILMKGFLKLIHTEEEASKIVQTHEMFISLKFIKSPSLEKRLNGIAEIRRMIELVDYSSYVKVEGIWFNADYLVKWIIQNNLLGMIFDDNTHSEIIKRSSPILTFLAKRKAVTTELLEILWKSQQDKHEDIVRAVYDSIKEIIEYLPQTLIDFIYSKIATLQSENVDEKTLAFMKDFTVKAFAAASLNKTMEKVEKSEGGLPEQPTQIDFPDIILKDNIPVIPSSPSLYFTERLWYLVQDESPLSQALYDQAFNFFKELIPNEACAPYRPQYLYLCMENIKAHKSVTQSLCLAIYFLAIMNNKKGVKGTVSTWLKKLNKEYSLIEMMIGSCKSYEKLITAQLKNQKYDMNNIGEQIISGKFKHAQNIDMRLKFLEYVVKFGCDEQKVGKENLGKLWNLYIEESACEFDTKQFLKWISSDKEVGGNAYPQAVFQPEESKILFDILCRSRDKLQNSLGLSYYKCFSNYFKLVNISAGTIEVRKGRARTMKFSSIIGLDQLTECLCYSTDETSRNKFTELLLDVYTNLHESLNEKRVEIMHSFIDHCMTGISKGESQKDDLAITNIVKLLITLFDNMDGKKYEDNDDSQHKFPITVTLRPVASGNTKSIEVHADIFIGQLRKKIADLYKLPFDGFTMNSVSKVFDNDEDDQKLRNVGWVHQLYIQKIPGALNLEQDNPKIYLAHNQTYINTLFVLLSKEGTKYVDSVWYLLNTLPPNKKMQTDIETMKLPETGDDKWNSLLDSKSVHKFLYSLQIIEGLLSLPTEATLLQKQEKLKWLTEFCEKQGLAHLMKSLISLPITNLHNPLTRKCFSLLMKILIGFQSAGFTMQKFVKDYEANKQKIIERIMTILDEFAEHSILKNNQLSPFKTPKKQIDEDSKKKEQEKSKKIQEEESTAFEHGFALIKGGEPEYLCFQYITKYSNFKDFLLKGLILSGNPFMQHAFAEEIIAIYKSFKGMEYNPAHAHVVLLPYMLQTMIYETLEKDVNCERFYKLLCTMIKDLSRTELKKLPMLNFEDEIKGISNFIKSHHVKENKSTDTDYVLIGLMSLLEALLSKFPEEKEKIGQEYRMIHEILEECLFEFPKSGDRSKAAVSLPPKCKSRAARQAAFNLLTTLCCDCPKNLTQVLQYLTPIHANAAWRTKRISDWNIAPESGDKSITGYIGLKNLGCICYMNSLMQQFYMIPSFRNDILAVVDPKKDTNPDENPLFQTQCMFSALTESVKQYYNPKIFCHAIKDWEGKSVNVLEQMDVDEYFNLFLDRLEFAIKGTPQAQTIKKHFGGVFANQLLGKDCPHSSVRDEPFLALNLQVKNKKSLQQCLESFVEGEVLQGSNAYNCEKCDKKVTALKRTCIKRLPRHLICVLKRFDINYDTMQKFKINDYCEFPMKMNMKNYTAEGLAMKDFEKEREKAKKEGRDLDETTLAKSKLIKEYPAEYYEYKLSGVVIHIGSADAGHYYSLIMDRENKHIPENERWYEFNDTVVDKYNPEEIKDDAFGGDDKMSGMESFKSLGKIRNAYLLFYERASDYDPPEEDEDESPEKSALKKQEKNKPQWTTETVVPEQIHKAIVAENTKYWYNKFMFHDDYFDFALKLGSSWNTSFNILDKSPHTNMDYHLLGLGEEIIKKHAYQHNNLKPAFPGLLESEHVELPMIPEESLKVSHLVTKYIITVLLTTVVRSKYKTQVPDFIDLAKSYLNKHPEISQWLLWQFSNPKILSEFLLESCESEMRRATVGLLYCAMLSAYQIEAKILEKEPEKCSLINFLNGWFNQLLTCRKFTIYFEQFFQLISKLCFIGPEMRQLLHKIGALRRLLGFWANAPETKWNDLTEIAFKENKEPELGLPSSVDDRFQSPFEEYFAAQREKRLQEADPSYPFLIEAVSLLIRSTALDEKSVNSPYALPGCTKNAGIDEQTKAMLLSITTIKNLIADSKSPLAISSLLQAFQHISYENMEMKMVIIKGIVVNIGQLEWDGLKKLFYLIKELFKVKDSCYALTIGMTLSELVEALKETKSAFYAMYFALRYTLCLCHDYPEVREWLKLNAQKWEWIFGWLEKNNYPNYESKETKPFKSKEQNANMIARGAGTVSTEEQITWTNMTSGYAKLLMSVKNGEIPETQEEIGDNATMYYDKFYKEQPIEYCDARTQAWEKRIVKRVLDEMLLLQPEGLPEKYADWVETDSAMIAKNGTHIKNKEPAIESKDQFSSDDSPLDEDEHINQ